MRALAILTLTTATALAAVTGTAGAAATQLTLGQGETPSVAVDDAGTAYVAWTGPGSGASPRALMFCRVPRGATGCVGGPKMLDVPGSGSSRPFVYVYNYERIPNVVVLQARFAPGTDRGVHALLSIDAGAFWSPAQNLGDLGDLLDAVPGPGSSISYLTTFSGNLRFQNVGVAGNAISPTTTYANLTPPGTGLGLGAVGVDGANALVLLFDGSGAAVWRRHSGAGSLNDAATWSAPSTRGYAGEEPTLSTGPLGAFAVGRADKARLRPAVSPFVAGKGFGAPRVIDDDLSANPIVTQDAGRWMHAVYGSGALYHAVSKNAGSTWTVRKLTTTSPGPRPRLAVAPDHQGVAVTANNGTVRLVRLGAPVRPEKALPPTRTIRGGGGTLTLNAPRTCVPAARPVVVKLTFTRSARALVQRITFAAFDVDGVQVATDTRAPFGAALRVRAAAPGTAHKIRARVTIALRGGGFATRSVLVGSRTCV